MASPRSLGWWKAARFPTLRVRCTETECTCRCTTSIALNVFSQGEFPILQHIASQLDLAPVLAALRVVLPADRGPLALHEPCFAGNEWGYVKETLDTGWVSSAGSYVDRFEAKLCEFTGAKHATATASGKAALHICLKLAGVEAGDEVL